MLSETVCFFYHCNFGFLGSLCWKFFAFETRYSEHSSYYETLRYLYTYHKILKFKAFHKLIVVILKVITVKPYKIQITTLL